MIPVVGIIFPVNVEEYGVAGTEIGSVCKITGDHRFRITANGDLLYHGIGTAHMVDDKCYVIYPVLIIFMVGIVVTVLEFRNRVITEGPENGEPGEIIVDPELKVFTDADKSEQVDVFEEDEKARNCRHCAHYIVNPFTQRCALHFKEVQATDLCDDFEVKEEKEETPWFLIILLIIIILLVILLIYHYKRK